MEFVNPDVFKQNRWLYFSNELPKVIMPMELFNTMIIKG